MVIMLCAPSLSIAALNSISNPKIVTFMSAFSEASRSDPDLQDILKEESERLQNVLEYFNWNIPHMPLSINDQIRQDLVTKALDDLRLNKESPEPVDRYDGLIVCALGATTREPIDSESKKSTDTGYIFLSDGKKVAIDKFVESFIPTEKNTDDCDLDYLPKIFLFELISSDSLTGDYQEMSGNRNYPSGSNLNLNYFISYSSFPSTHNGPFMFAALIEILENSAMGAYELFNLFTQVNKRVCEKSEDESAFACFQSLLRMQLHLERRMLL